MTVPVNFPASTKTPVTAVTVILGSGGSTGSKPKKVLCVGVGNPGAGYKAANTIWPVSTGAEADTYWGAGYSVARMCRCAIEEQLGTQVYGLRMADVAGTANITTITFAVGPAATACSYSITINGWTVTVPIPATTTAANAAIALDAAIKASEYYSQMPITSGVLGSVVSLTAKEINVETKFDAQGIWQDTTNLVTLTATLSVNATPGATSLSTTLLAALGAAATAKYDRIVVRPSDSASLTILETYLDTYAMPLNGFLQQGIAYSMDTPGNQITMSQAVNAYRIQVLGCELFQTRGCENAARWAAHRAYEEDVDAGCGYKYYPLKRALGPALVTDYMTGTEIEAALNGGVTPLTVSGTEVQVVRSITSRSLTAGGAPDFTVLDTANVSVPDACADDYKSWASTAYLKATGIAFKVMDDPTDGTLVPGYTLTPNLAKVDAEQWLDQWYSIQRIVNPRSPTDYTANVVFSRVGARLNGQIPIPVCQSLMVLDVAFVQSAG